MVRPIATKLLDLLRALPLECLITHGQNLVDQEHLWFNMRGNRESESYHHARGEVLDGSVDELLETCELHDAVELAVDLLL